MPSTDSEKTTRQRLLNAAGECFAEHGFHGAPVREISQRAGANVAAVNYHFGDKFKLYESVLLEAINYVEDRFSALRAQGGLLDASQRLNDFIGAFLMGGLDPKRPAWHCKVLCLEMADPGPAVETLFAQTIGVRFAMLRQIISDLLDPTGDQTETTFYACSVLGQTLYYLQNRRTVPKVLPGFEFDANGLDMLTTHITEFSLAAIEGRNRRLAARSNG